MSDSSLVTHELYTTSKTTGRTFNGRTYQVDTITIHCTAGNNNSKGISTAQYWPSANKRASATYCIGGAGDICQNVLEADRPWTTGGSDYTHKNADGIIEDGSLNDYHAITMEVASNADGSIVNAAAIEATINLCVDIMKRHGKTKAVWFGNDPARMVAYRPASNEMKFTWHCWFANKSCPGPFIKSKFQYIIDEINKRLGGTTVNYSSTVMTIDDCKKALWTALLTEGCTEEGAAGLMGNIQAESNFRSNNLQNSYEKSLGMTDEQYTQKVDSGEYQNFIKDSAGYGLAQWTYWSRKEGLFNYLRTTCKVGIGDTQSQIEYLLRELKGYKAVWPVLTTSHSVRECSNAVLIHFEAPASKNEQKTQDLRTSYGEEILKQFSKPAPTPVPEVKDTIEIGDTVKINAQAINEVVSLVTSKLNGPLTVKALKDDMATMSIEFSLSTAKLTETKAEATLTKCTPYIVRAARVLPLQYFAQPKDGSKVNGSIKSAGTYTIVAMTSDGAYGQLKSGAGFIRLADVDRL